MREKIINISIESLRQEGLKFSVDTLAGKLGVSKKTIYKYFPDKEMLALAIYEKYYNEAKKKAEMLISDHKPDVYSELLYLYFDSKTMIRKAIFNKYKLNESIYAYTTKQNDALWDMISASFENGNSEQNNETLRIIIDGSFEKICDDRLDPDAVIERLVQLL